MLLQLNKVNKYYSGFHAVKDLSLEVEEGDVYGILGRNGAGKTSTIRMIMDIYDPESGDINRGYSPEEVSYLPEERGLYPKMTLKDTINFFGEIKGMSRKEIKNNVEKWLAVFQLEEWYGKKVENLSKGMQQKVQLMISIMNNPRFLILDEPFSGLDAINIQHFKDVLVEAIKSRTTVLFSTHIIEHAENICSKVLIIDKGMKVLDGKINDVKEQHGKNSVYIRYDGDGSLLENHFAETVDDYGQYAEVVLRESGTHSDYLRAISKGLDISEFRLDRPSLKSIFIDMAGGESDQNEK